MPRPDQRVTFRFEGSKTISRKIRQVVGRLPRDNAEATFEEAEAIAQDARDNYVPVDRGDLRDSIKATRGAPLGQVESARDAASTVEAGGPDAPYALTVHEHPSSADPPTWKGKRIVFQPDGRGPKFIERPMREASRGMAERLARQVERTLREMLSR